MAVSLGVLLWIAPHTAVAQTQSTTAPQRRTRVLMLSLETGVSHAVAADRSATTATAEPGGTLDLSLLYRPVPWVAMGLQLGFAALPVSMDNASTVWTTSALLQARLVAPVGRVDLWLGLGAGFGALTQAVTFINADRITTLGPSLAAGAGVDVFVHGRISVGAAFRVVRVFPGRYCLDDRCTRPGQGLDPGLLWRAVVSLTYHFEVGRRSRSARR